MRDVQQLKSVFLAAVELPAGERRIEFLRSACQGDDVLRREVDRLLRAHLAAASDFLEPPGVSADETAARLGFLDQTSPVRSPHQVGTVIDQRFELVEPLGEGGMGMVWVARQLAPLRRTVAIKLIKPGMDTRQVLQRFEVERQALALMDHPNIARVLDGGATPEGQPYFVMELIDGVPLTRYCDAHRLSIRQRLDLFTQICSAVQHAHQKGVIHRDLKPSNLLVTEREGKPIPKVIDFGLAKALDVASGIDQTMYSQQGLVVGTPLYIAPERLAGGNTDVDTRSDIYSLGVILYELLTGSTPLERDRIREMSLEQIVSAVRGASIPRPSSRLAAASPARVDELARLRRTTPGQLRQAIARDLEWIVLKALDQDRERRYATANGLALDVRRHLSSEPVLAAPPSRLYQWRKWVRRHRGPTLAAGLILATLLLGIAGTTTFLLRALRQQQLTAAAQAETQRELTRTSEVKRLLTEMLVGVGPDEARGSDITLLQSILDRTAQRLQSGEVQDELIAAELHAVIGDVYRQLARYDEAESHTPLAYNRLCALRGKQHPETLAAMAALAALHADRGRFQQAVTLFEELIRVGPVVHGRDHPSVLKAMGNLAVVYRELGRYPDAEKLLQRTIDIASGGLSESHPCTLRAINSLANLYADLGRQSDAESLYRRALGSGAAALGADDPGTLQTKNNLATLLDEMGRRTEAEELFRATLAEKQRVFGPEHPSTLETMNNLANLLSADGEFQEAKSLHETVLTQRRQLLGDRHPKTLASLNNLAVLHERQKDFVAAERLYLEALEGKREKLGETHPDTLLTMVNLGYVYSGMQDFTRARERFEIALPVCRRVLGDRHRLTSNALRGLTRVYHTLDQGAAAVELHRDFLDKAVAAVERPDADCSEINQVAWQLITHEIEELQNVEAGRRLAERVCQLEQARSGKKLWMYLDTLAMAQYKSGDIEEALATQRRAIELLPPDADDAQRAELETHLRDFSQ